MFYFTDKGWQVFDKKISYRETIEVYDTTSDKYQGKDDLMDYYLEQTSTQTSPVVQTQHWRLVHLLSPVSQALQRLRIQLDLAVLSQHPLQLLCMRCQIH